MGKYDDLSEGIIEGAQGHLAWSERAAAIVADIDTRLDAVTPPTSGGIGLDSPEFTGTPKAPTAAPGTATTQIATTAFVAAAVGAGSGGGGDLTGTGSPEGAVTAPPGTYYTDTAGTCGAWRWLKTSGTGSTGWRVLFGDTGWRNVTGVLSGWPAGMTGSFYMRCREDRVYLSMNLDLSGVASGFGDFTVTGVPWAKSDPGTLYPHTLASVVRQDSPVGDGRISWAGSDIRFIGFGQAAGYLLPTSTCYLTSDPWPSTLPGTPA